ncbi:MAG: hypothetical protein HRT35_38660, partial [Algicola sp.]|nr:hypothetical protein [Algicola sp.]
FAAWCEYQHIVASQFAEQNTSELNRCFNIIAAKLIENGGIRDTIEITHWQASLALARMDLYTVEACHKRITTQLPQLQKDLGASADLADLHQRLKAAIEVYDQQDKAQLTSEDLTLTVLAELYHHQPQNEDCLIGFVDSLSDNGYTQEARKMTEEYLENNTPSEDLLKSYGYALLQGNDTESFDNYFGSLSIDQLPIESAIMVFWLQAYRYRSDNQALALQYLQKFLNHNPTDNNVLQLAAELAMADEQYPLTIDYVTQLIDLCEDDTSELHWDRMVPATIIGRWDIVRESCQFLELDIEDGDGRIERPVTVEWPPIRIQLTDQEGLQWVLAAERTGPVSATIMEMCEPAERQYFADDLVFDPSPLNQLDQEDDEGYACDSEGHYDNVFKLVKTLATTSHFFFTLDGVYPGDDHWQTLIDEMGKLKVSLSRRSSDEYILIREDDDKEFPAIYALLACPEDTDLTQVNDVLLRLSKAFGVDGKVALIWPQLAQTLGSLDLLQQQGVLEILYNIE